MIQDLSTVASFIEAPFTMERSTPANTLVLHATSHFSNELTAANALSKADGHAFDFIVGRSGGLCRMSRPDLSVPHLSGPSAPAPGHEGADVAIGLCNKGPVGRAVSTSKRYARRAPFGWIEARHSKARHIRFWEIFGKPQLDTLVELMPALIVAYPALRYVCGHEDMVKGAMDPGPAFPWALLDWRELGLARIQHDWRTGDWYRWGPKRRKVMT